MGSLARMTRPYRAAIMDNNWVYVKKFYEKHLERLGSAVTLNGDTALHLAVYTRNMDLLQALLDIIKEEKGLEFPIYKDKRSRFPAKDNHGQTAQEVSELPVFDHDEVDEHLRFQATDYHGQTALHLAAIDGNLKALKLLLEYDEKLLTVENNRKETPLFLAATFGKTKAVKYLAAKIKDRKPHIKRDDRTSILHIAILGEYFETAVELLKWILSRDTAGQKSTTNFDELAHMVDENGMTGLQLLASMPTAFKSGYRMGKFKTLLYYCLPDVDYAETYDKESDRKSQDTSSWNKVDLETGNERENQQTENYPSSTSSH